jgi:hypothetical protein
MSQQDESFFSPLLSTIGWIISIVASFLPLFDILSFNRLFDDPLFAKTSSIIALLFGMAITWMMITIHPFPNIRIKGTVVINTIGIVYILFACSLITYYEFIVSAADLSRSIYYVFFFASIIGIFAILIAQTKIRFDGERQKDKLPDVIVSTLEKNKLLQSGISIRENKLLDFNESRELGYMGLVRRIRVIVRPVTEAYIKAIISSDGKELLNVEKGPEGVDKNGTA